MISKGNLLIAPPIVKGNFWYKSVIIVTECHLEGTVGIVLNKRSQLSIKEFGNQLNVDLDYPGYIYQGGPLNVKSLSFLHTPEWTCKNTMAVNKYFSISSADDILPRLAMGDQPLRWRIFLGMCGWGQGQLESEIKGSPPWNRNTSWCLASSEPNLVFDLDNKDQWVSSLDRSALEFAQNIL